MNLSFGNIVGSLVVSGVGFVFFNHGRKKRNPLYLVFGIAMMIYPYFISNVFWMLGIGAALTGLLIFLNR